MTNRDNKTSGTKFLVLLVILVSLVNLAAAQDYQKYVNGEPRQNDYFSLKELQIRAGATASEIGASTTAELNKIIASGNETNLPFKVDKNYPDFYFIPHEKRPSIFDQGSCGSCVAWSSATALASILANEGKYKTLIPSLHMPNALTFFLSNARMCKDSLPNYAWYTAPGVKTLAENGTFMALVTPQSNTGAFGSSLASNFGDWYVKAGKWGSLTDHDAMRKFIATKGALVADFTITEDFNKYDGGIYNHEEFVGKVAKPLEVINQKAADQLRTILKRTTGGHAVAVIGYFKGGNLKLRDFLKPLLPSNTNFNHLPDTTLQNVPAFWIVQNSWGTGWGMKGYFYVAANQNYKVSSLNRRTQQLELKPADTLDNRMFYMLEPKVTSSNLENLFGRKSC